MLQTKKVSLLLIFVSFAVAATEAADKDKTAIDLDLFFSKQQEIEGTLGDLLDLNGLVQKYKLHIEPSVSVISLVNAFENFVASYHLAAKEYNSVLHSAIKLMINGGTDNNSFLKLKKLSTDFDLEPLNILKKMKSEFRQLFDVVYVLEVSANGYFNFKNTKETELILKYSDSISEEVVRILQKYTALLRTENSAEISEKLTMALIKEGKLELSTAKDLVRHLEKSRKLISTDLDPNPGQTTKSSESKLSWFFSAFVFGFNFLVVLGIYVFILTFLDCPIPQNIDSTSLFSIFISLYTCYYCAQYISYIVESFPFFSFIYILAFLVGAIIIIIATVALFYLYTIVRALAHSLNTLAQALSKFGK